MRRKWRYLLPVLMILTLFFVALPRAAADSSYVVQPGENLFRIALRHGLTTAELAAPQLISEYVRPLPSRPSSMDNKAIGGREGLLERSATRQRPNRWHLQRPFGGTNRSAPCADA